MSYSQALLHYKGFHAIQVWMASAACCRPFAACCRMCIRAIPSRHHMLMICRPSRVWVNRRTALHMSCGREAVRSWPQRCR